MPVIKFKSKDIDMDLTVARLMCNEKILEDEDFLVHPTAIQVSQRYFYIEVEHFKSYFAGYGLARS